VLQSLNIPFSEDTIYLTQRWIHWRNNPPPESSASSPLNWTLIYWYKFTFDKASRLDLIIFSLSIQIVTEVLRHDPRILFKFSRNQASFSWKVAFFIIYFLTSLISWGYFMTCYYIHLNSSLFSSFGTFIFILSFRTVLINLFFSRCLEL